LATYTQPVDNAGFATVHGKLRVDGVQLVDSVGQPVQLMGMSSHGLHWFPDCYTKESIAHLVSQWGINVFRAAMYVGEGGYATDASVKARVTDIVQWCRDLGIYAIIDWHVLTPGNPNDTTYSGAVAFWQEMAAMHKDEDHVLYEIANEPNNVNWGGNSGVKAYHQRVVAAIRAIDTDTVILAGTPTWSQDIHTAASDPLPAPLDHNLMYAFHFYAGTHAGLLQRVKEYAPKIPIFCTEWGTSEASGNNGPFFDTSVDFLDVFADRDGAVGQTISWAQWSYADKAETSAALVPGACARQDWDATSCSGSFLRAYIRANVGQAGATQAGAKAAGGLWGVLSSASNAWDGWNSNDSTLGLGADADSDLHTKEQQRGAASALWGININGRRLRGLSKLPSH
jgi:endoglucanase